MRYSLSLLCLVASGLLLSGAVCAVAAIPGADDPKCYTQRDYHRGEKEFAQRMFVEAYKAVGKHDLKWDAAAVKFLDAFCVEYAYGEVDRLYSEREPISFEEMRAMGKGLVDLGCDDPLVTFVRALHARSTPESRALMEQAIPPMIERKYPAFDIAHAARMAMMPLNRERDAKAIENYNTMAQTYTLQSLCGKIPDADLRYLLIASEFVLAGASSEEKADFSASLEKSKDANPWLAAALRGWLETEAAWDERGSGWANAVGEDQWKKFGEHLRIARDYLTRAQSMHPEFPEAASEMISVAMGAGRELNEKERDWFDKAVKAQFDFGPAFKAYILSLYPKWGGSHREMFQFGEECLATQRFDTDVPMRLMGVVHDIDVDSAGNLTTYSIPEVRAAVRKFLDQAAEKTPKQEARDYLASYHVALAMRAEKWEEAADVLNKIGDRLRPEAFARMNAWAPAAIGQIRIMNSKYAKAAAEAEGNVRTQTDAAIAGYADLSAKLPKDDLSQIFLKLRLYSLKYQKDLVAGDWVTINPTTEFVPWVVVFGDFKVAADGSTVATADSEGRAMLLCRTNFGQSYEIRLKIGSPDPKNPSRAVVFLQSNEFASNVVGVDLAKSSTFTRSPVLGNAPQEAHATIGNENELHVLVPPRQRGHAAVTVELNGHRAFAFTPLAENSERGEVFVGIGIEGVTPGAVARFREIQIKRIAPPKAP
jgi:hypothetical protein